MLTQMTEEDRAIAAEVFGRYAQSGANLHYIPRRISAYPLTRGYKVFPQYSRFRP